MNKYFKVLVVVFFAFFSVQGFSISPENKDRLKAEWEATQGEFLHFVSTSDVLKMILVKNDFVSKTEILETLFSQSEYPKISELEFDTAFVSARLRAALYLSNTYRADYIEGISALILTFEKLLSEGETSVGASQIQLASSKFKDLIEGSIRAKEQEQAKIRGQIRNLTGRESAREKKRGQLKIAALELEIGKLKKQIQNEETGSKNSIQGINEKFSKKIKDHNLALAQSRARLTEIREAGNQALINPRTKPDPISFLELGDANRMDLGKSYPKIYADLVSGLFTELEDLAEIPSSELERYLVLIKKNIPEDNELNRERIDLTRKVIGLTPNQAHAFRNFLLTLIEVYELEQKRRSLSAHLEESLKPLPVDEVTLIPVSEVEAAPPIQVIQALPALVDSFVIPRTKATQPVKAQETPFVPVWTLDLKITSNKVSQTLDLSDHEKTLFEELKVRLQTTGPKIKAEAGSGFRNCGALGKRVYHCHLGSSSRVAVWSAKPAEKKIILLYLGEHPNTYKTILRRF